MEGSMAIDKKLIDQLLTNYKKPEDILGENGLLKELTKAILERALQAEMTDHLGYEKHDPAGLCRGGRPGPDKPRSRVEVAHHHSNRTYRSSGCRPRASRTCHSRQGAPTTAFCNRDRQKAGLLQN